MALDPAQGLITQFGCQQERDGQTSIRQEAKNQLAIYDFQLSGQCTSEGMVLFDFPVTDLNLPAEQISPQGGGRCELHIGADQDEGT